jgi:hypothetical protein
MLEDKEHNKEVENKTKPRGPGVIGATLGLRDSYKEFKKNEKMGPIFDIDYKKYRAINEAFNKRVVEDILLDTGEHNLPYRLGTIRIQKKKMNLTKEAMKVDWKATKELGKRVYHMNDHRDNYRYKWYWKKSNAIVQNKSLYSFTASRANKRELARILKEVKTIDYFE